jgi:hypothetical protein
VVLDVGLGGEPHDTSSTNTAAGAPATNRVRQFCRRCAQLDMTVNG